MDFSKKPGSRDRAPSKGTRRYQHNQYEKQNVLRCFDDEGNEIGSFNVNKKKNWEALQQLKQEEDVVVIDTPYIKSYGKEEETRKKVAQERKKMDLNEKEAAAEEKEPVVRKQIYAVERQLCKKEAQRLKQWQTDPEYRDKWAICPCCQIKSRDDSARTNKKVHQKQDIMDGFY